MTGTARKIIIWDMANPFIPLFFYLLFLVFNRKNLFCIKGINFRISVMDKFFPHPWYCFFLALALEYAPV
jgi:hypothetical protein